jgi:O-antigen/teichoic acid export membrane protein
VTSSLSPRLETRAPPAAPASAPGAVRSGALLLGATVASVGATYLFYLVAGRLLGPADYGTLAAVLSLVTLASLPFTAFQMSLSRDVSRHVTRMESSEATALTRALVHWGALSTFGLVAIVLALTVPLEELLKLDSPWPIVFAAVAIAPTVLFPILLGDLQGRQQFLGLSIATAFPLVFRFVLFLVLVAVGWRLYGALAAMAVAAFAGVALPAWWRRDLLRSTLARPAISVRPFLVALVPVLVALLAVTALTNVDVLFVKARLSSEDAGIYGAASAFAKVAFFLPMAIVGVVFPRVAARRALGRATDDILGRALLVTIGFCAVLFLAYGLLGEQLIRLTYGSEFDEASSLLGLFGVGMSFFSIANILVSYRLSRHEPRLAWLLAAAALCQAVALGLVPADLETFLWVNAAVGGALLLANELLVGSTVPALRSGFSHAWEEIRPKIRIRDRLAVARRPLLEAVGALAGYTGLVVFLTWPLAAHLGDQVLGGGGDVFGTIGDLWRQAEYTGYHVTGVSDIEITGAPYGWEQGNGVNVQSALPYYPAYLATKLFGEIVAYNLVALSGLVLSGAAMYWLARRITGSVLLSAWAGFAFVIFPWHFEKAQAHASLAHLEGFPLLALALIAWYRKPRARSLVYVAGAVAVLWTTSGYYGVMGLIVLAVLLPLAAWYHRRRFGLRGAMTRFVLVGGSALAVGVAIYGVASLGKAGGEIAPERDVIDLAWYGARIWEFFVPSASSVFFDDLTYTYLALRQHRSNLSETSLYVGWLTLLLALAFVAVTLVRWRRVREQRRFLCLAFSAMVVLAVLFMPPHPISLGSVEIPSPAWLVWKAVPQFRVPTRWMPVLMLGLISLAALALVGLRAWLGRRQRGRRSRAVAIAGLALVVGTLSFVELSTAPPAELARVSVTPEYELLTQAPSGLLVEYPLGGAGEGVTSDYIFWQRVHGRPILNGAPADSYPDIVRQVLIDPAAPGVASALSTLGVSAVITRGGDHPFPAGPFSVPKELGDGYRLIGDAYAGGGTRVWEVVASPEPFTIFPYGFWFSERFPGRLPYQWMSSGRAHVQVIAPRAGRYVVRFEAQSWKEPRRLVIHGLNSSWAVDVESTRYPTDVFVPVEVPRGRSTFELSIEPGPTPGPAVDGRLLGVAVSNWLFEESERLLADATPVRPFPNSPDPVPERAS